MNSWSSSRPSAEIPMSVEYTKSIFMGARSWVRVRRCCVVPVGPVVSERPEPRDQRLSGLEMACRVPVCSIGRERAAPARRHGRDPVAQLIRARDPGTLAEPEEMTSIELWRADHERDDRRLRPLAETHEQFACHLETAGEPGTTDTLPNDFLVGGREPEQETIELSDRNVKESTVPLGKIAQRRTAHRPSVLDAPMAPVRAPHPGAHPDALELERVVHEVIRRELEDDEIRLHLIDVALHNEQFLKRPVASAAVRE